jgi:hypothetical protein
MRDTRYGIEAEVGISVAAQERCRCPAVSRAEILNALRKALSYLAANALRAHPKRDRKSGHSQLGLEQIF